MVLVQQHKVNDSLYLIEMKFRTCLIFSLRAIISFDARTRILFDVHKLQLNSVVRDIFSVEI